MIAFIISIAFKATGASAWTYVTYANALKSLKGVTSQGSLYKNIEDNQILEIDSVYQNREIDFRIAHEGVTSTWQYVGGRVYPKVLEIHGGLFSGNQYIAYFTGTKELSMRTVGIHIGVTSLYGTWWVNSSEYYQYLG